MRKHLEIGTSIRHLAMSDDQKQRLKIGLELYNLRKQNPYLDISTYLKNKYGRTYWEIRSDRECYDFICSILDAGGKNIARAQVRRTYEMAAKIAHDQGDAKNMISAAKHLSELERLLEPEQGEDLENSITKLPIVFTGDPRKILPGKTYTNEAQKDKLRAKWGVKKDVHQDMVDVKAKELLAADDDNENPPIPVGFDLSSLSASQLAELQAALNARMAAQEPEEIDDEDDEYDE